MFAARISSSSMISIFVCGDTVNPGCRRKSGAGRRPGLFLRSLADSPKHSACHRPPAAFADHACLVPSPVLGGPTWGTREGRWVPFPKVPPIYPVVVGTDRFPPMPQAGHRPPDDPAPDVTRNITSRPGPFPSFRLFFRDFLSIISLFFSNKGSLSWW